MKQTYALVLALSLPLFSLTKTFAQHTSLPDAAAQAGHTTETLSGINMKPAAKGTFQLDFSQQLDENALLEVKDSTGKLVYQKPVSIAHNRSAWRYNLGRLKPDTYLIEVKTSDTTYWTKFKVQH
ncbi:T9SS type A sorting domain-containing protein [Pontibacter mangrovi]|uniref:T9SS C-terminal target domain-containing protein n=1 Tax=Pontibacter mangrovi TaxID=2589816 RepID=A0A501WGS3_9BACT|nr:hypothetical protein [Pontibacter mangrovi]TPE46331.1 hypothetical protein FJM65_03035 [Pontibacter mangrovi]